ncbi:MAG: SRPBCC family protein [Pyrinomonadaceae bacterium]
MIYQKQTVINSSPERVFGFHELPDAFERLVPPFEDARVVQLANIAEIGSRAIIETKIFGLIPVQWVAEHTAYDPPRYFEDVQISGPFKSWKHGHFIEPHLDGTVLRDVIEFEPPMSFLGVLAAPIFILPKIGKMFEYRHRVTKEWCENAKTRA